MAIPTMQELLARIAGGAEFGEARESKTVQERKALVSRFTAMLVTVLKSVGLDPIFSEVTDEWVIFIQPRKFGFVTLWKNPREDWQLISGVPEMALRPGAGYRDPTMREEMQDPKRKENREAFLSAVAQAEKVMAKTRDGALTKDFALRVPEAVRSRKEKMDPGGAKAMGETVDPFESMRCDVAIPTIQDLMLMEAAAKGKRDKQTGFPLVDTKDVEAAVKAAVPALGGAVTKVEWKDAKPRDGQPLRLIAHITFDMAKLQAATDQASYARDAQALVVATVQHALAQRLGLTGRSDQQVEAKLLNAGKAALAAGAWPLYLEVPRYAAKFETAEISRLRLLLEKLEKRSNDTFVFTGKGARLTIGFHGEDYRLEELPAKGKRQVRVAALSAGYRRGWQERAWDAMMPENVLADAKLADSDDFDAIKAKIAKAVAQGHDAVLAKWVGDKPKPEWIKQQGTWREQVVPAGRVAPEGGDTDLVVDGKDFALKVTWKSFRAYAPDSDFQQSDPYYSGITEKNPSAAAKLFKLLQAQPAALKGVAYKDLGAWLDDHKVARKAIFSTWS